MISINYKKIIGCVILVLLSGVFISAQNRQIGKEINPNKSSGTKIQLPYKYIVAPGKDALNTSLKLRQDYKGKITPVIIGSYDDAKNLSEALKNNNELSKNIIKNSLYYSAETLKQSRLKEDKAFYSSVNPGKWPKVKTPIKRITSNTDILSGEYLKEVYIVLVPTGNSYEVPAYLKFGGWNDCPSPEEQVGILRYWYKKYGAQVISITSDVVECTVDNPPNSKEEALNLAKEQFYYCSDIVFQGANDISTLAATLYKSKYWYFWWD